LLWPLISPPLALSTKTKKLSGLTPFLTKNNEWTPEAMKIQGILEQITLIPVYVVEATSFIQIHLFLSILL
jgi:hypothetical protein